MEPGMKILRFLSGLLDRLFVVAGAFMGSQIPQFIHQYMQRLAGHVDELNYLIGNIRQLASHSNKTLEQYIDKFLSNGDPDFVQQGQFMQTVVGRWQDLSQTLAQLNDSSFWTRPYVFVSSLNPDIAKATFYSFVPGISLSIEGLYYTGLGLIFGYCVYHLIAWILCGLAKGVGSLFKRQEITNV